MNKKFKLFSKILIMLSLFLYNLSFIKVINNNNNTLISNKLTIDNKANTKAEELKYNSYFSPIISQNNQSTLMYFGRILKYYYANNIIISEDNLTKLENDLVVKYSNLNQNQNDNFYKQLFLQNIFASTINLSIYGSSSDAEFFAEAFSKWLTTPDELKNKSWEITNDFFTTVLPEILKTGGALSNTIENSTLEETIIESIDEVLEEEKTEADDTKYNLDLNVSSNSVDLQYMSSSFLEGYYFGINNTTNILSSINSRIANTYYVSFSITNAAEFKSVFENFLNDSYTKASDESIESFKNFNTNNFSSFEDLNSKLILWTKDVNQISTIDFERTYSALEKIYLNSTPMNFEDSEKWTTSDTQNLKELTLFLYNILFSMIQNEAWVKNLLTAFIITPDYPIYSKTEDLTGVMGITSNWFYNDYSSSAYSSILLTGLSLTFKQFNSDYTMGFWSSPAKYSVLIHEFGHALDGFGSKMNNYRDINYSSQLNYYDFYEGTFFENAQLQNNLGTLEIFIIVLVTVGATATIISLSIIFIKKKKKAIK